MHDLHQIGELYYRLVHFIEMMLCDEGVSVLLSVAAEGVPVLLIHILCVIERGITILCVSSQKAPSLCASFGCFDYP